MGLSKYRIGELISVVDERNDLGLRDFYGININKEFMPTVADTEGLDETKYKIVRKNRFVYSGMQTGRDQCIRISMYDQESPIIVSPAYTTFEIADSAKDLVIPMYFFMLFLSKEKDRLGAFYSDGSIRSNLDWDRFCDIEILLPSKEIQKKYVDIYNAALNNQRCYERGLEDLKFVCDGFIEDLRRKMPIVSISDYITQTRNKNELEENLRNRSVSNTKCFIDANDSIVEGVDTKNYLIVEQGEFAYNTVTTRNADKLSIALNTEEKCLVSPLYTTFKVKSENLVPKYLCLWLLREEYDRYARYQSWGSARELFPYEVLSETKIPLPKVEVQQSIANIFDVYKERKQINERLKEQIKRLCPILINGSLKECQKA